jgi:antitoxin HicB
MAKDLRYYLELKYPIVLAESTENGKTYFEVEIPDLPGCGSFGENIEEALSRLAEAKELWIEARLKRALSIPEPVSEEDFSGKFLLRITPELHRRLASGAKSESLSLNQYARKVLEERVSLGTILDRLATIELKLDNINIAVENPVLAPVADMGMVSLYGLGGRLAHRTYWTTAATGPSRDYPIDRDVRRPESPDYKVTA